MNGFPTINRENVKLLALWALILIFVLMFWHFVFRELGAA